MIGDIVCEIILGLIFLFVAFICVVLCISAGRYDRITEEQYREFSGEDVEVKYIIAGDTEQYKGCLVMACGSSKERAEETLQKLLSDPDERDKIMKEGYSNLRVEEVEQKDCWWED